MFDTESPDEVQAALENLFVPQAPSNVISFSAAKNARIPQGERPRAYRVRPAPGNRGCRIDANGYTPTHGIWYYGGAEDGFVEITRIEDGKIAYARKTDDWRNADAWAHKHFLRWHAECDFWKRFRELREGRNDFSYGELTEPWDIVLSPACFEVLGWKVRYWLEKLPQQETTEEEWDAHMAPVLEYLKTA